MAKFCYGMRMVTMQSQRCLANHRLVGQEFPWNDGELVCVLRLGCEVLRSVLLILAASRSMDIFTSPVRSCLFHLRQSATAVPVQCKNCSYGKTPKRFLVSCKIESSLTLFLDSFQDKCLILLGHCDCSLMW